MLTFMSHWIYYYHYLVCVEFAGEMIDTSINPNPFPKF